MTDSNSLNTKLTYESIVVLPQPPSRFSLDEWHFNNSYRNRICLSQQKLADSIKAENVRLIDEIKDRTEANRKETDCKLEERLEDIKFATEEVERQRKELCLEIDNLLSSVQRIEDCNESLSKDASQIVKKCLILREGRFGIDLCHDNVERELLKEMNVIDGAKALLNRTLEQANEQVRRLRSNLYIMDRDLEDKHNVLKLDKHNASLKHTSLNLSIYYGFTPLDPASITEKEWEEVTKENIQKTFKELGAARQLRSYVDILLKQVINDLKSQYHIVNNAYRERVEELKRTKMKTEVQHAEIVRQAHELTKSITDLEKAITEKEGPVALVHTRLGNRAQRPGMELCKDIVGYSLGNEIVVLRNDVVQLQHKLAETYASVRYLLKTQIQLEEDINIKTNSIKIDEVDCMTIRQNIDYHYY